MSQSKVTGEGTDGTIHLTQRGDSQGVEPWEIPQTQEAGAWSRGTLQITDLWKVVKLDGMTEDGCRGLAQVPSGFQVCPWWKELHDPKFMSNWI